MLDKIEVDRRAQLRAGLDEATVARYVEAFQAGARFPALDVFFDKTEQLYFLADGFHRYEAARRVGRARVHVHVHEGTLRDAILFAARANVKHGLPRNDADKRKTVLAFLGDMEWRRWSDREIARRCAVSDRLVNRLRQEVEAPLPVEPEPTRMVRRSGRIYSMRVRERKRRKGAQLPVIDHEGFESVTPDQVAGLVTDVPVTQDSVNVLADTGDVANYRQALIEVELRERVYQLESENKHLRVLLQVLRVIV